MFKSAPIIKNFFGLFSVLILLASFSSAYLHTQKMGNMDMPMPGCPMMTGGAAVICTMSPLEHLQAWQSMFQVLPSENNILLLCLALLALLTLYPHSQKWPLSLSQIIHIPFFRIDRRLTYSSYITEAFSSGILNPKLY